jgi:hypothetical protein
MPTIKSIVFCTNCRSFFKINCWPLPYSSACPRCGYVAPLFRRRSCRGHDVSSLKGLLVVRLHSEIGQQLLEIASKKDVDEMRIIQRRKYPIAGY